MTCIVGIEDKGDVWIGADSLGSAGDEGIERLDSKVFYNGQMLFGCAGSYRMLQLLQYNLVIPKPTTGDNMKYMVVDFVGAVRECFKEHGYGETTNNQDMTNGQFMVGLEGTLYTIEQDYQVAVAALGYHAIGSGSSYALGALAMMRNNTKAENRVRRALEASAKFCVTVAAPFEILNI